MNASGTLPPRGGKGRVAQIKALPLDGGGLGGGGAERDKPAHASGAIQRARRLRREMTLGEKSLWKSLRYLKLNIRRQAPVGRYVADFIHHESRLVIEVDGGHHGLPEQQLRDVERDAWFESQGYRTIRIDAAEACRAPDDVARLIVAEIQQPPPPNPPPSRGRATTSQPAFGIAKKL